MRNDDRKKRAARETKPTVESDDIFAGRTFWQFSSEEQNEPEADARYRVNESAKFYVLQLMGSWVNVSESAERTIKYRNRVRWVRFENKEYQLRKPIELRPFLSKFINGGCYAYVGGKDVYLMKDLGKIKDFPFIYIASTEALRRFNSVKENHGSKIS